MALIHGINQGSHSCLPLYSEEPTERVWVLEVCVLVLSLWVQVFILKEILRSSRIADDYPQNTKNRLKLTQNHLPDIPIPACVTLFIHNFWWLPQGPRFLSLSFQSVCAVTRGRVCLLRFPEKSSRTLRPDLAETLRPTIAHTVHLPFVLSPAVGPRWSQSLSHPQCLQQMAPVSQVTADLRNATLFRLIAFPAPF